MPIATPEVYAAMLDKAKRDSFANPAINVSSSQTLNAALRGPGPWQLCGAFGTGATTLIKTSRNGRRAVALTDSGQAWVLDTRTFDLLGVFTHGAAVSFAGLSDVMFFGSASPSSFRVYRSLLKSRPYSLAESLTKHSSVPSGETS